MRSKVGPDTGPVGTALCMCSALYSERGLGSRDRGRSSTVGSEMILAAGYGYPTGTKHNTQSGLACHGWFISSSKWTELKWNRFIVKFATFTTDQIWWRKTLRICRVTVPSVATLCQLEHEDTNQTTENDLVFFVSNSCIFFFLSE